MSARVTKEEQEARAVAAAQRAERLSAFADGPIFLVPSAEDLALGYRLIAADEDQLESRKSLTLRNAARAAGWYVVCSQVRSIAIEAKGREPEPVLSIGVHAFTTWPPADGDIGLVAWWRNGGFDFAQRADYREGTYFRTDVAGPRLGSVIKEKAGNHA